MALGNWELWVKGFSPCRDQLVFQHTLAESWVLLLVGEQLENYPYEHSMVEHVDVCLLSDALMGNCISLVELEEFLNFAVK